ncbi:MAG: heat-inducible transcriptional repressor HrcA [Oscillospiraceae bacterium]|jgi:heat-inducible transcriptional repressor|nr:heat-inducible transcriptional repressor HrcA [Oscillospiraceae bacterium]
MNLGDRKKDILRAIIDQYVDTAEPVGSKSISSALSLSPATIRNEMAELESCGLLEQPHTSAGRIPTPRGYRVYVNELMHRHKLSIEETEELNRALQKRVTELDRLIAYAGLIASRLTSFPAYALSRGKADVTVSRFDLIEVDSRSFIAVALTSNETVKNKLVRMANPIPEGLLVKLAAVFNASFTGIGEDGVTDARLTSAARAAGDHLGVTAVLAQFTLELLGETVRSEYSVSGSSRLLSHPEYRDVGKAQRVLDYLSNGDEIPNLPAPEPNARAKITIGPENLAEELRDSSVVVTRYDLGDGADLLLGVVGPTRMDYAKILTQLQYLGKQLTIDNGQLTVGERDNE